ncbi:MAG: hypothetical protein GY854_32415 [Deltaproteobacteria bacterium]|nr:hypothetical protein [Deltaproteobacteria bacterium]
MSGSVTSIGVAYARTSDPPDLARFLMALLGTVFQPRTPGRFPMSFVTTRDWEVRIETSLKDEDDRGTNMRMLERFLVASYGELELAVDLHDIGMIEAVLRPEAAVSAVLLDLSDNQLFPKWNQARSTAVEKAIRDLLISWYEQSPFRAAFADHEAEFDIDPLELRADNNPYALLAMPAEMKDAGPLEFHQGGWLLSPVTS